MTQSMIDEEPAPQPRAAVQMYSLYDSSDSVPDLVRRAGRAGFEGVEFAGRFLDADPRRVADTLERVGVEAVGVHAGLETLEAAVAGDNDLLERCSTVGCDRVVIPHLSPDHYTTLTSLEALASRLNSLADALAAHEMDLVHHTSSHEFRPVLPEGLERLVESSPLPDGATTLASRGLAVGRRADVVPIWATGFWHLADLTTADNFRFELDVGEVAAARVDPVEAASLVSERLSLIHLCDVAPSRWLRRYRSVQTGEGTVDLERIVEAARAEGVDWLIYEDEEDRDPSAKLQDGAPLLHRLTDRSPGTGSHTPGAGGASGEGGSSGSAPY